MEGDSEPRVQSIADTNMGTPHPVICGNTMSNARITVMPRLALSLAPGYRAFYLYLIRSVKSPLEPLRHPIIRSQCPLLVHPILHSQIAIARRLKHATQLERPRDPSLAHEEVSHLESVSNQPIRQHGDPEAFARSQTVIFKNLRDRQNRFDAERHKALDLNISLIRSNK